MTEKQCFEMETSLIDDDRVEFLIEEMGPEGWGIYTLLLYRLRKKPMWRCDVKTLKIFARKYMIAEELLMKVVHEYHLFSFHTEGERTFMYSPDLYKMREMPEENEAPKMSIRKQQVITAKRAANGRFTAARQPYGNTIVVEEVAVAEEAVAEAEAEVAAAESMEAAVTTHRKKRKDNTGCPTKKNTRTSSRQTQCGWEEYIAQVIAEKEWVHTMTSETRLPLSTRTEELIELFKRHVKMHGNEEMIYSASTAKRYMANFFRPASPTHKRVVQVLEGRY